MQLPGNAIHKIFSEIDVTEKGNESEIFYSTMVGLAGKESEGWKTGIAVDASVSMIDAFGKGLTGSVPEDIEKKYKKKGWIQTRQHDGERVHYWEEDAFKDAIKRGYLSPTTNIVEPEVRKFSSYIADNLDSDGKTDIIYWACGEDGKSIKELGEHNSQDCLTLEFKGPKDNIFGKATYLLPAVKYFEQKYRSAKRGMFIFITDGQLNDLDELKKFTIKLAREISANKRDLFKAILIGIGGEIDENQMVELDDLDTGTDVDIWDHKIAREMKDVMEIFAELVDENMTIAPFGTIYDSKGNVVKKFNDGVPAKGWFRMPKNSSFFTLEVEGQTIKQTIRRP
ncbi:VWA domain-containing protein [bacterium]|nr:VWA domain-containing protein [bacterium]